GPASAGARGQDRASSPGAPLPPSLGRAYVPGRCGPVGPLAPAPATPPVAPPRPGERSARSDLDAPGDPGGGAPAHGHARPRVAARQGLRRAGPVPGGLGPPVPRNHASAGGIL